MSWTIYMVDGDFALDSGGHVQKVTGARKASQDIAHALMFPYDGNYGFALAGEDGIIPALMTILGAKAVVLSEVTKTVARLQAKQKRQSLPPEEQIASIADLQAFEVEDLGILYYLSVSTTAGYSIESGYAVDLGHQLPADAGRSPMELTQ